MLPNGICCCTFNGNQSCGKFNFAMLIVDDLASFVVHEFRFIEYLCNQRNLSCCCKKIVGVGFHVVTRRVDVRPIGV